MRIDQFINAVNIVKSRKIAKDMIEHKTIFINDNLAKGSKTVQVGEIIKIVYLDYEKKYEILKLPTTRHTKKSDQDLYVKEISS